MFCNEQFMRKFSFFRFPLLFFTNFEVLWEQWSGLSYVERLDEETGREKNIRIFIERR